mgnify:CR=1 FL=1
MAQNFTSSATSINSTKLPAVYRKVSFSAPLVLDYGCGRYTDHILNHLTGKIYLPYDPYNQPDDVNRSSMFIVSLAQKEAKPVDVICSNVLNVIDDEDTIRSIAKRIETIVNRTGGTGSVTVYEGNRSGSGRQTGSDQYQRNEPLRNYLRYFTNATIKNGMIVVGR